MCFSSYDLPVLVMTRYLSAPKFPIVASLRCMTSTAGVIVRNLQIFGSALIYAL